MASILLGVILTVIGAANLALAMVLQRYGLSYPEKRVPFMGLKLPRLVVWFAGLVAYGTANGFYATALNFGPLSLLACVFTLLLVFNLIFARLFLGEVLTPPKVVGCLGILFGVCLCVLGAAQDAPTTFSPRDIEALLERFAGGLYVFMLLVIVFASVGGIIWYERRYPPLQDASAEDRSTISMCSGGSECLPRSGQSPDVQLPSTCSPSAPERNAGLKVDLPLITGLKLSAETLGVPVAFSIDDDSSHDNAANQCKAARPCADLPAASRPSKRLDAFMSLVYPGSLGLDEGIAHLTMKGTMAMLSDCGLCQHWSFYLFLVLWISSSVATAWWLKVVFARYETTAALPVEYGMVNLASVCSGLVFYNESQYMKSWQLLCSMVGLILILLGIQCSTLQSLPSNFLSIFSSKPSPTKPHKTEPQVPSE